MVAQVYVEVGPDTQVLERDMPTLRSAEIEVDGVHIGLGRTYTATDEEIAAAAGLVIAALEQVRDRARARIAARHDTENMLAGSMGR